MWWSPLQCAQHQHAPPGAKVEKRGPAPSSTSSEPWCVPQALLHIGRQIVLLLGGNVNKSVAQVNALLLSNMVQEIDEQGLLLDGQRNTTLVAVQRASPRIKVVISGV